MLYLHHCALLHVVGIIIPKFVIKILLSNHFLLQQIKTIIVKMTQELSGNVYRVARLYILYINVTGIISVSNLRDNSNMP